MSRIIARLCDHLTEWLLLFLIVFTPLAFGTVEVWSNGVLVLCIQAAILCIVVKRTILGEGLVPETSLRWPIALFVLLVGLQLTPMPSGLLRIVSRETALLYEKTGVSSCNTLSIYRYATITESFRVLACIAALLIVSIEFCERKRQRRLVVLLIGTAAFVAFYGIIQHLTGAHRIFGFRHRYALNATGTFINRNHFAGYLGMTVPMTIGAIGWTRDLGKRILLGFLGIIMVCGILLSASRMGIAACAVSLLVMALLAAKGRNIGKRAALLSLGGVFIAVLLALWLGIGELVQRFSVLSEGVSGSSRLAMWRAALKLLADYPVFGTGFGTFGTTFPAYKPSDVKAYWEHAHNDYLEIATDMGLVGALVLLTGILVWGLRLLKEESRGKDRSHSALTLACAGSVVYMLLHSITDFNMHISSNSLTLAIIMGLAVGSRRRIDGLARGKKKMGRLVLPAVVLILIGCSVSWQIRTLIADREFAHGTQGKDVMQWDIERLGRATRLRPGNVEYSYASALHLLYVRMFSNTSETEDAELLTQAGVLLDRAIQACPASAKAHALKAHVLNLRGEAEESARELALARELDPSWVPEIR